MSSPSPTLDTGQKDPLSLSSKQSQEEADTGQDVLSEPANQSQIETDSGQDFAGQSRQGIDIGQDKDPLSSPAKQSRQETDSGQDKDPLSPPVKQSRAETDTKQDKDPLSSPDKQLRQETEIGLDNSDSLSSPTIQLSDSLSEQPRQEIVEDNVEPMDHENVDPLAQTSTGINIFTLIK